MVRTADHYELADLGHAVNRRTVTRHLTKLGLGHRRFLDPCGESNREPGKITAHWPGHMVHLDVKKVGRIPDGGGWHVRGRDSEQAKSVGRAQSAGAKRGHVYLHSAVDGFSRLAYTEPLADEKGWTAAAFLARAKVWFAAHGIIHLHRVVTDNGACYRSGDFARTKSSCTPASSPTRPAVRPRLTSGTSTTTTTGRTVEQGVYRRHHGSGAVSPTSGPPTTVTGRNLSSGVCRRGERLSLATVGPGVVTGLASAVRAQAVGAPAVPVLFVVSASADCCSRSVGRGDPRSRSGQIPTSRYWRVGMFDSVGIPAP